jgi:ABC-type multidrug transport system fused ATPase/permease subunit
LSEVGEVVHGAMLPILMIIVHGTVSLFIIILLIYIDIELALIVASVLITFYLLIFQFMKKTLTNIGSARLSANKERYTSVSEAFGAIKEIKVRGLEGYFSDQFSKPAKIYANSQISSQMRAQLPRYALEIIAFGGLLLMMLVSMRSGGNINDTLPIISLYAFAGYRLIPALQQVYSGFTVTRYSSPSLESLHNDMKTLTHNYYTDKSARIKFKKSIKLNDVNFSYPRSKRPSLSGVNIEIPVHSIIGFVGSTGSGKTTMVDLIMGLLVQQQGSLSVDGEVIDSNNRHQWQQCIGYVPQQIHLSDDSIASNIAFGVEKNKINQKSIERAAKIANLHEFVVDELPEGYATIVGERGVRLSGGQRQRIGIARALYHMPQVLILDEATSALDSLTELAVMESVNNLGHDITIIIIAHRLSTVRQCDQIYLLEGGCIGISGTYDQLKKNSNKFKSMVNV